MQSKENDKKQEELELKLQLLAEASNKFGGNPEYVFMGGGNSSVKDGDFIYIKPSGVSLEFIKPKDFLKVNRKKLTAVFQKYIPETMGIDDVKAIPQEETDMDEAVMSTVLAEAVCSQEGGIPSVETPLHNIMEWTYVMHLHPILTNGMTCAIRGREVCAKLFPDAVWVPYCNPGYPLARDVLLRLRNYRKTHTEAPHVIFLQNHGVFVGADTISEIHELYDAIEGKIASQYDQERLKAVMTADGQDSKMKHFDLTPFEELRQFGPCLRNMLAETPDSRAVATLVGTHPAFKGPLTPDHIVYAGSFAYSGPCDRKSFDAFKEQYGYSPKVISVEGKLLYAVGKNYKTTHATAQAIRNAQKVELLTAQFGGPRYLTKEEYTYIETWKSEKYRKKVSLAERGGRLDGKVCVITGAAQGFGYGIARYLASQGATIVVADMNEEGAEKAVLELCNDYGRDSAIGVKVDISDEQSVHDMVYTLLALFGGIDLFVANAGVVRSGSVMELSKKDWEFVTSINYTGYFLCVKHISDIMRLQYDGRGLWMDIVQVNSKSGLEGSNRNGAYAGSKFGGIGLTQSFAKELVDYHIKVNSVCPGNYYDGPLWSNPDKGLFVQYLKNGKVPGAKTVQDVKDFYEAKVPMHRGCQPSDVAKAIIYCVEQDYETGQAIPVTGGQVMLH